MAARGMCSTCYQRHRMAGTLDDVAPSTSAPSTYVPARERTATFGKFQLHPSHLKTGPHIQTPAALTTAAATNGPLAGLTPDVLHAAALHVCARSTGPDDARGLLVMLGLVTS